MGAVTEPDMMLRHRKVLLIIALVCGAFGIGISEFLVMGLLPEIAQDLLPALFASAPDSALAATGSVSTAYALGVVVGMVTTPVIVRRLSERSVLISCASAMLVWTLLLTLAPNLFIVVVLRFLAALTHATYVAGGGGYGTDAPHPASRRGERSFAWGLAAANLLGVPALTAVTEFVNWRMVFGVCVVLFVARQTMWQG